MINNSDKKTVLYLDNAFPKEWLESRMKLLNAESLDFQDYRTLANKQRAYLSDYIPYALEKKGFDTFNIICDNQLFLKKANNFFKFKNINDKLKFAIKELVILISSFCTGSFSKEYYYGRRKLIIEKIIRITEPQIIIVREPLSIDTNFWKRFKNKSKILVYIGVNTKQIKNWNPFIYDGVITIIPIFYEFFKTQGISTTLFQIGIDRRVFEEFKLNKVDKKYDVIFIGYLGNRYNELKSSILEYVASKNEIDFKWWGPENTNPKVYPNLYESYMGLTGGQDMLEIMKESKIVLNLYVDTANGVAVNMRTSEIISVGTFPLFMYADNLKYIFPEEYLNMFVDKEDCVNKIKYWLDNSNEQNREKIASELAQFAISEFSYEKTVDKIIDLIETI